MKFLACLLLAAPLWSQVFLRTYLEIGPVNGSAGSEVAVPFTLAEAGRGLLPAFIKWTAVAPANVSIIGIESGPSAMSAGKLLACDNKRDPAKLTCVLAAYNNAGMNNGVVARVKIRLSRGYVEGELKLQDVSASTAEGWPLAIEARNPNSPERPKIYPAGK